MISDDSTRIKPARVQPRRGDERPFLEIVQGLQIGRIVWLAGDRTVIGRGSAAGLELADDGVSRRHAKVILGEDGIVNLKDLGSTNGTFVNGAPIDATVLREGDRIQLGPDVTLRFGYGAPVPAPKSDPPIELSAREMEVARLVADGLTNPEIAQALHISRHTVVSHLSNVFERTEVRTRAALAKLVAEGRVRGPDR